MLGQTSPPADQPQASEEVRSNVCFQSNSWIFDWFPKYTLFGCQFLWPIHLLVSYWVVGIPRGVPLVDCGPFSDVQSGAYFLSHYFLLVEEVISDICL